MLSHAENCMNGDIIAIYISYVHIDIINIGLQYNHGHKPCKT